MTTHLLFGYYYKDIIKKIIYGLLIVTELMYES